MDNFFVSIFSSFWQLIWFALKAFLPLLIGVTIAYILNGPVEYIGHKLSNNHESHFNFQTPKGRIIAILITYMCVAVLLFSTAYAFIVLMLGAFPSGSIISTIQRLYDYLNSIPLVSKWLNKYVTAEKLVVMASKVVELLINLLLGIVASIYLLKDKEFFLLMLNKFLSIVLPQKIHGIMNEIFEEIHYVTTTFLKGALIDSIIISLISSTILFIINIKYAAIIGIIAGLLNVIPYFGPFFSMIPAFFVTFSNQGVIKAFMAVISLFLVQQLDSNYIYPKIVGTTTGLHPLFVLLSVSVMGYFFGILGMLLAVPIAGILQVIIKKWAYSK